MKGARSGSFLISAYTPSRVLIRPQTGYDGERAKNPFQNDRSPIMERPNAWKKYDDAALAELDQLCEDYRRYISENKT